MDMQHPTNRGPLYVFEGIWPMVHESAFIAPTAAVIGNVTIGEQSNIW
jgi:carbonic anhydrase/acetyltransferase-like protein (isoleucine patch superfamily)